MSKYKLSICIPTYNRAEFIGETIQSVIDATEGINSIEIVISDNASTDNTKNIVDSYKEFFPNITYFCWDRNMGVDRNFLKVVEIASGEFCWLMGSDDRVENNSIDLILSNIEKYDNLSGITLNTKMYDSGLCNEIYSESLVANNIDIYYESSEKCFSELGYCIGYISAQIVRRELWQSVVEVDCIENYFNGYVHMYVIAKMLEKNPSWLYIHKKCVGYRSNNDSLMSEGRLKRLAIDVYGYEKITGDVYGQNSRTYNKVMATVCGIHIFNRILDAKLNNESILFCKEAFRMCFNAYKQFPIFWLKVFPLFLIPSKVMPLIRVIYRNFFKKNV